MADVTKLTQGRRPADFILTEANGQRSREAALILNPNQVEIGEVLEVVAETSDVAVNYKPLGADPSKAAAIAIYNAATSSGDDKEIAIIARDAEVNGKQIQWPSGYTAGQKRAGIRALADVGIIVRDGHEYQW